MHGANNYPWHSKMRSNYDIDLEDDTGDDQYLAILFEMLQKIFSAHNPSLIFFQVLIYPCILFLLDACKLVHPKFFFVKLFLLSTPE
jgi:hypothetical protein